MNKKIFVVRDSHEEIVTADEFEERAWEKTIAFIGAAFPAIPLTRAFLEKYGYTTKILVVAKEESLEMRK